MRWPALMLLGVALASVSAHAATLVETEQVMAIKPDASMVLSSTGNAVFADVLFPDRDLAQAWLGSHVLQQKIGVTLGDTDRYGRTLVTSDVQSEMLHDGVAVVYTSNDDIPGAWDDRERDARVGKKGVWANKNFVLTPQNAAQHEGQFHVVEGAVTRLYEGKSATSINFGDDWHTDFSISIGGRSRKGMKEVLARIKPGTKLRVRGTLVEENGPMIRISNRHQLEIL